MKKRILKNFPTMAKAAAYQNRLYNIYNSVQLVSFPVINESGTYIWEVTD